MVCLDVFCIIMKVFLNNACYKISKLKISYDERVVKMEVMKTCMPKL